jgi:hypothetical protein
MFDTTFAFLSSLDRPAAYYRTLFQCLNVMDPVQYRRISATEICKEAHMSHMSAQRGMAMLQADKVLIGTGIASARKYRLNNNLVSMTSSEKWNNLTRDPEVIDARGR